MMLITEDRHADAGALMRLIDREPEPGEEWVPAHARECVPCAARLRELRARSERARLALRTIDPVAPPLRVTPRRARTSRRARWLLGGALLAAGAAAAAPVARRMLARRDATAVVVAPSTVPSAAAPSRPAVGPRVRWLPEGPELVVRVAARAADSLVLVRTADARASAQLVAGSSPLLVAPGELRIAGAAATTVRVELPAGVRAVRIVTPGRAERRIALPPGTDSLTVLLPD